LSGPRFLRAARRIGSVLLALATLLALGGPALAAVPTQKVSADPYTNTSSFHRTQVEPDTFSFGSTIVSTFQTGRFSNGGASNICWSTSQNNGQTWTRGCLPGTTVYATPPGPWDRISDPAVSYDPEHDVWMITGLTLTGTTGKAVLVSRSTDGGLTWQNPVTVAQNGVFFDKEWIVCDTWAASAFYGNCYIEWDDAGLGQKLLMSRSTDGGLTWTPSTVPNASVLGGVPVVQPNGTVVMPILGTGIDAYVSTNGGQSYSGPFNVASQSVHPVAGSLRVNFLPSAEVDASGKVFVAWEDCRFRSGCSSNDIVFTTSTDGQTWSAPTRIPIDPTSSTVDHFIPGIGVDRSTQGATAHVGVTYYFYPVANCTVTTCKLKAGFVESLDGGATWSGSVTVVGGMQLKGLPLTTQGYMVGDYISTSFGSNGQAYPVIPRAKGAACVQGDITSCNQFMVAPVGGLAGHGPTVRAGGDPVLAGTVAWSRPATAF
jgi:hypothetical protein